MLLRMARPVRGWFRHDEDGDGGAGGRLVLVWDRQTRRRELMALVRVSALVSTYANARWGEVGVSRDPESCVQRLGERERRCRLCRGSRTSCVCGVVGRAKRWRLAALRQPMR